MQRLGQHFLKNKEILEKIVDTLNVKSGDVIVEIGPGHGELTKKLLERPVTVVAIEKDLRLVDLLTKNFKVQISNSKSNPKSQLPKLNVINADALKALPSLTENLSFDICHLKLVGNIPYYITGHLLRILSELEHKPEIITLLVQKEVAERVVARPPKTNLLAAVTQSWSDPKIIAHAGRKDFSPPPKVDSAVIVLRPLPNTLYPKPYFEFLHALFKQPRKTIANNLMTNGEFRMTKDKLMQQLREMSIDPGARPQNLSLAEIQNLFAALYN
ncbi:MAG: 16S rRNA (adenine(1518)-N(6)/adenine(1519)-N(6))-dimethyltransferase RsmA [Patescibacteria group bacterium]|nr:16S rRNA (adenine(1518)-N(6)/adenine(1519)-N(6))-dimethyltransferase RsmA [Patescibacteria group bacterium]